MKNRQKRNGAFLKGAVFVLFLLGGMQGKGVFAQATLPTLPQTYIDTTYSAPTGATCTAANSAAFQTCLNNAALNSTITLQAGTTYTGPFTLPNKTSGSGWIYIVSSNLVNLPTPGNRVGPANATNMPVISVTSAYGDGVFVTQNSSHHYRFVGIEFKPVAGSFIYSLINIGNGETTVTSLPHHFVFDRCYIHGDPSVGGRRGVAMNGINVAVIDSYVSDFKENGADTQAIWGLNTPGPLKIVNNYLEATGENILFCGTTPSLPSPIQPSDIEIRRNYFFKPLTWRSQSWGNYAKNLLEFKCGDRVLIEGNVFENSWIGAQKGMAVLVTPRLEDTTWFMTRDLTFKYNKFINSGAGFSLAGYDDSHSSSQQTQRLLFSNNMINVGTNLNASGRCIEPLINTKDVVFDHNTFVNCPGTLSYGDKDPGMFTGYHENFTFINNLAARGEYGFLGDGGSEGTSTLNVLMDSTWIFTKNAIWGNSGVSGSYPANNYFPANTGAVGFTDYAGGNYRLSASSPYKNLGTDGKDLGADIDALDAETSCSVSGQCGQQIPDTESPTSPTNLAATSPSQSSISVSWTASTDNIGVTGYIVERCQGSGCSTFTEVGTPSASPFVDTGLTAGTFYNYHVRARDAANNLSGWSNVVGATTQAPDTQAPTAPSSLSAVVSSSNINLTWTASTDNVAVTGYRVERCQGSGCTSFTQIGTPTTNSYSDTGLSASTLYRYRVRATDAATNNSPYSNIAEGTTPATPPVSANMMAAYNFNEGTGSTLTDLSGHNNTGTLTGATWNTTGKYGNSLTFNGTSNFVSIGTSSFPSGSSPYTLSAWIKTTVSGDLGILGWGTWGTTNAVNAFRTEGARLVNYWWDNDIAVNASSLLNGSWHHVAATFDGTTRRLWFDGTNIGQDTPTSGHNATLVDAKIGRTNGSEYFNGSIDDLRIYNTALTQTEIQTDMNTPLTSGGGGTVACNTVTPSNFSDAAYNSYGAPYDLFAGNAQLVDAECTSSDPTTISATIGKVGDTTRIAYTRGYYYDPGASNWAQYTGTCTGTLNGDWCAGPVTATINDADISTASAGAPVYLAGMVCSVQSGGWKCGCRDTTCGNFYWQIQGAGQ